MNRPTAFLCVFLAAFALTVLLMPLVIKVMKRLKARQVILHYVEQHKAKSGTPTMGGIGFILPLVVTLFFAKGDKSLLSVTLAVTIGYGVVGFLDDFIKVFFRRNDGLSPWQKIAFQVSIALIVSIFAYNSAHVKGVVYWFFSFKEIDLKRYAVILYVFLFLLMTNSVNLTDGLDGLASGVTVVYTAFFAVIMYLFIALKSGQASSVSTPQEIAAIAETQNLILFCSALVGGLLGFLCFNAYPAKIFMGDTGSLALGGALACLAVFSRRALLLPLLGVMYMASSLSVIMQVAYFKKTRKRIFLMAPLHHHFQMKGMHESKIGLMYSTVTAIMGAIIIVLML